MSTTVIWGRCFVDWLGLAWDAPDPGEKHRYKRWAVPSSVSTSVRDSQQEVVVHAGHSPPWARVYNNDPSRPLLSEQVQVRMLPQALSTCCGGWGGHHLTQGKQPAGSWQPISCSPLRL